MQKFSLWIPVIFAALVCFQAHRGYLHFPATIPGLGSFFVWLPMVFYFVAIGAQANISRLEKRISDLERKIAR